MGEQRTWIIGSDPACDLVVARPSVSWRHCRLTRCADGSFTVEDLGSTNGTFINGRAVRGVTPVRLEDRVTLGQTVPMPWPSLDPAAGSETSVPGFRVVRVGRDPDNEFVIDSPEVSARHARVLIAPGGREGVVEDLGSTNGTAVGTPENAVTRAAIRPGDVLYFGPVRLPAATFFPADSVERRESIPDFLFHGPVMIVGRDPGCDLVVDFPVVSARHARFVRAGGAILVEDLGSANGTYVNAQKVARTTTAKSGDLIGLGSFLVRLVDGSADRVPEGDATVAYRPDPVAPAEVPETAPPGPSPELEPPPTVSGRTAAFSGIALGAQTGLLAAAIVLAAGRSAQGALFGMALTAVWFGITSSFFERLLAPASFRFPDGRGTGIAASARAFLRAALLDLGLCGVLLAVASARIPFEGRWPTAFGILWLSALVGSALGRVLVLVSGRLLYGIAAAVGLMILMASLGGPNRPFPRLNAVARVTASALPARWTFESLLLVWSGTRAEDPAADPVEPFFPAEADRAGMAACVTSLLGMFGGAVWAELLIALSRRGRDPRGGRGHS